MVKQCLEKKKIELQHINKCIVHIKTLLFYDFISRKAIDSKQRIVLSSIDKDDPCLVYLPSAETLGSDQRG